MPRAGEWQEIEELFFAAEDMTPAERVAYLDRHCAGRDDLRQKVERLLAAGDSDQDLMASLIGRAAAEMHSEQSVADVAGGERLGAYRLLEEIGQGGMGTVYRAERVDGEYQQEVAIKVIREGLVREVTRQRFLQERQILARLDHPAVASLLDGGTTADGQPYLVMEYVDGLPIDEYCDVHQLSIRQRLELFVEVAEAVNAAHGNLIVHRDLKPSNILVTENGRPKLLDFGIAKLLDRTAVDGASGAVTTLGDRMLTPEYASPEQLLDEPVTTRVDIYTLGLLLHRLLSGTGPYPATSSGGELRRAICQLVAEVPSKVVRRAIRSGSVAGDSEGDFEDGRLEAMAAARGTTLSRWPRLLEGDLDHIVAKALRKEPSERYGSADRFAADVIRHLEGRPVEARRGGLRYRAGRFVRRHRTVVVATSAAILALTLGLVGQAKEARRANREALAAVQVIEFLTEVFGASDPYETLETSTVSDLLDRASQRIESELAEEPLVQARLMATLGRVYRNRGHFDESLALFQGALERRKHSLSANHPDVATGHLDLADNLRILGRLEEAMPHYEAALNLRREHYGSDSSEAAEIVNNMALAFIDAGQLARAEEMLNEALEIRRRDPENDSALAQTMHNLALATYRQGDYLRAEQLGREALAFKEQVLPPLHPSTGRGLLQLTQTLRELGNYQEAEMQLSRAIDILRGAFGEAHVDVLGARGDLAELQHLLGKIEVAEVEQRQVLELKRQHLGPEHYEVTLSLVVLAEQVRDQGHLDEALALLEQALEVRRRTLGPEHLGTARAMMILAETLCLAGRAQEAVPRAEEGLRLLDAALPAGHPRRDKAREILVACVASAQAPMSPA